MAGVSQTPPFPPPEDQDQKNIIDKLANFVARNGTKFEEMTKMKQKGNPKFAFLFSGEFYNYYRWKVSFEIAQQQTQQHLQNQQQLVQQAAAQFGTNPQAHLVQQAIVQQSINSAPWQQAQQQAQQQMQALQQQAQATAAVPMYQPPSAAIQPQPSELDVTELENLLHKIMESCTKDSISNGKNFIFTNAKTPAQCYQISQYLLKRALGPGMQFQHKLHIVYLVNDILHHCQRKGAQDLQKTLEDIVVPLFFCTQIGESPENLQKVTKVLGIWESHNLFEPSLLQELKNTEAGQSKVDAAKEQVFGQGYYVAPERYQQYYQQPQDKPQIPQADQQPQQGREDNSSQQKVEESSPDTSDETKELPKDHVKKEIKEENTEQASTEEAENREEAPLQQPYQPPHYQQHPPPFPPHYGDQGPQYYGHGPPPFAPHFPPPPYMPDFSRHPPPMFGHPPPPNFHDEGYHGRPPPPPFRGPPQQFDYQHQRPDFEQYEGRGPPPMVNEYNHGRSQEEEGYGMEEYDMPPELPIPEPIVPSAMYYELPAGLMAPLVGLQDVDYMPLDSVALRLPAPQPPSERLLAAVEAFYSPPSHERPRNSEGWEQSGLFEFYKAKLKYIKDREEAEKHRVQEFPPSRSRSRSRSRSPRRSRSPSPSPRQRRSRSRSKSPPKRRHHSRSRSRSISPRRRRSRSKSKSRSKSRSRSRSKSRSRSISPMFKSNRSPDRSPTPPSFHPSYTSKVPEQRLDESNVGHQMLKKMGWEGAGLGRTKQGIQDPISGGEARDKFDKFKGVGVDMKDPFEAYRKSKSYSFLGSRIAKSEAKAAAKAAAIAERKEQKERKSEK